MKNDFQKFPKLKSTDDSFNESIELVKAELFKLAAFVVESSGSLIDKQKIVEVSGNWLNNDLTLKPFSLLNPLYRIDWKLAPNNTNRAVVTIDWFDEDLIILESESLLKESKHQNDIMIDFQENDKLLQMSRIAVMKDLHRFSKYVSSQCGDTDLNQDSIISKTNTWIESNLQSVKEYNLDCEIFFDWTDKPSNFVHAVLEISWFNDSNLLSKTFLVQENRPNE